MKTLLKYTSPKLLIAIMLSISGMAIAQPVANFNVSSTTGCSPAMVQFTDISTGLPTSWAWDFGNGSISTQKNLVITYVNPGVYTVKLTVSNNQGVNTITKTGFITIYDKPIVRFSASDSAGCTPFSTNFFDQSSTIIGSITSWNWDFDDGTNNINIQNPNHFFSQAGNYNITLQVTNSGGCTSSLSKLAFIKVHDSIRTQFNFSKPAKCKPPETISFSNNTVGTSPLTYTWDFGDGSLSNAVSPTHVYTNGGVYTLKLIATNNSIGCTDTLILQDTLIIKNIQSQISSADTVCVDYPMPIVNATIPLPLSSRWLFSDSTTSFGAATAKTWDSAGDYSIKLVSHYTACSDSVIKQVKVLPLPVVNFTVSDSAGCLTPFTVNFTDLTPGASSWLWDFGDGNSSTQQNPIHTYLSEGTYDVTLSVTGSAGCHASFTKFGFIHLYKPKININVKDGGGCIPYRFNPTASIDAPDGVGTYLWNFGNGNTSTSISPVEIYTDSGTYTIKLTVTSLEGCVDSLTIPAGVRTGNKPYVNFGASVNTVCPGINVQFTDSSQPADRWLWRFGGGGTSTLQNPQYSFSDSGKMTIKLLVWNNGCVDSLSKPQLITVLPGLSRFRVLYNCNNKLQVSFRDSSVLPQSWLWNFGDGTTSNTQHPTYLYSILQNYTATLTTTSGPCTNTSSIRVRLIDETPDFNASKNNLCKSDSVLFYFQNFNTTNIGKYIWDFGDGYFDSTSKDSVSHVYNNSGVFNVSLTAIDNKGCRETTTKPTFVTVHSPKAGFAINTAGGCLHKPLLIVDTSNAQTFQNIATWIWDFGDGQTQVNTAPLPAPITHTYNSTGYYYPSLKIIDSVGCADSVFSTTPVYIYQPVANFFSPNFNTCNNDTVILRNPSTGTSLSYLWSFGDSTFSTDSLPIKQYTSNGSYAITLVVTDIAGCTDTFTRTNYIRVREVVSSFTPSDSIGYCVPFQVRFTNNSANALSQVWDFGDGGFSTTANPVYTYTIPGTYQVKLTSRRTGRCVSTDSLTISVNAPTASLSYTPSIGCGPLTVAFNVSTTDTLSYIWDFNDGGNYTTATPFTNYIYQTPGNFLPAVVLRDSSGCLIPLVGTDTVKILSSIVNFTTLDSTVCLGMDTYFFDSSTAATTITNYQWDFGDGNFSSLKNPIHQYTQPGIYSVTLVTTTAFGCTDTLTKSGYIKVYDKPQINITGNNATYCGDTAVTFFGHVSNPDTLPSAWSWNFANGQTASIQNPTVQQYIDTGTYQIQLILSVSSGCADTANTTLTILPVPLTFAGNDTVICEGNNLQLQPTGAVSYIWQPATDLSCTNCPNPVTSTLQDIQYIVTGTNLVGCQQTDSIYIRVQKPLSLSNLNNQSICLGETVPLTVSGAENYQWVPATGLSNTNSATVIAQPLTSTTYTVVGADRYNCFTDTSTVYIEVRPVPQVNAGADIIVPAGRSITINPQYSSDVISWLWTPATALSCTTCPNPVAIPANGTQYQVVVTNHVGCTAQDTILLKLHCDKTNIYMPTAFSPGGVNKTIYPLTPAGTLTFTISSFKIYNRAGQLVFQNANFSTNDNSKGWDGKYKGMDAAVGAYVYTLEFICDKQNAVFFSGNILLLR